MRAVDNGQEFKSALLLFSHHHKHSVMFFAFAFAFFLVYWMLADLFSHTSSSKTPSFPNAQPNNLGYHFQDPYREPPYQRGPIFSPDRKYFWDGEKWIPNEPNNHFGAGVLVGLVIAAVLVYYLSEYL